MGDVASDPTALELLRVQRGRLADRMRPPWWYFPVSPSCGGSSSRARSALRYYSSPAAVSTWAILVPAWGCASCCSGA